MRFISIPTVFLLSLANVAHAREEQIRCPGFETGSTNKTDADRFYTFRALTVVRAALANDRPTLEPLVDPNAVFSIMRGDNGTSARRKGVLGAIEMARDLKPVSFQSYTVSTGPFSITTLDCRWSVTILFRTSDPSLGILMKLAFDQGRLINGQGDQVELIEGDVR